MTICVVLLGLVLSQKARAEEYTEMDTVARLGASVNYASLATLDQPVNAELISSTGAVLEPAFDMGFYDHWLLTIESQLRLLRWEAPRNASLFQDPQITGSLTGGMHFRADAFEFGMLVGAGQVPFISAEPRTNRVEMENVLLPHAGARAALNFRFKRRYFRLEGQYLLDLPLESDRSSLRVTQSGRLSASAQYGYGRTKEWLRLSVGFTLHQSQTNIGRQTGMSLQFGVSLGNIWGQHPPMILE